MLALGASDQITYINIYPSADWARRIITQIKKDPFHKFHNRFLQTDCMMANWSARIEVKRLPIVVIVIDDFSWICRRFVVL